jgi:hypothetical protein
VRRKPNKLMLASTIIAFASFGRPFQLMRLGGALIAVALVLCMPAFAQQRSQNSGAPGILRQWPASGDWMVILTRLATTHELACTLATGYRNVQMGDLYFWGIRRVNSGVSVGISDDNPTALAGPSIIVTIDDSRVGNYPITVRESVGSHSLIAAAVPASDAEVLMRLFRLGGSIKFSTSASTYPQSLVGARQAVADMDACIAEVAQLSAVRRPS